jgi:hypothetical protein
VLLSKLKYLYIFIKLLAAVLQSFIAIIPYIIPKRRLSGMKKILFPPAGLVAALAGLQK